MAFDKKNTFALGDTMKNLDFSGKVNTIKSPNFNPLWKERYRKFKIGILLIAKHKKCRNESD